MKKIFKLLIGCFVLIIFLLVISFCVIFFFGRQIWERVAPYFGMGGSSNVSNTYTEKIDKNFKLTELL
jgi:hypothetical protein